MKLFSIKAILSIKVHSQKIRIYFQNMYFQNAVLFSRKYVFAEKLKSILSWQIYYINIL